MGHAQRDHVGSAVRTTTEESRGLSEFTGRVRVTADLLNRENERLSLRDGYRCRITLLAVREGTPTSPCQVDLYHETGTGDLHSLPVDRSMAKTG